MRRSPKRLRPALSEEEERQQRCAGCLAINQRTAMMHQEAIQRHSRGVCDHHEREYRPESRSVICGSERSYFGVDDQSVSARFQGSTDALATLCPSSAYQSTTTAQG